MPEDERGPRRLGLRRDGIQRDVLDSRIGYRHAGNPATANTAFADGHSAPIAGDVFPRSGNVADNTGTGPTLYADPIRFFGL